MQSKKYYLELCRAKDGAWHAVYRVIAPGYRVDHEGWIYAHDRALPPWETFDTREEACDMAIKLTRSMGE